VKVGAAFVAGPESFELVEPGEGALDDPADAAEPGAMLALAARDLRRDPALAELAAVGGVVVAAIGGEAFGPTARSAGAAADWRHTVE